MRVTDPLLMCRWLFFSNWLRGDIVQYDLSDPANPKFAARIFVGGVARKGDDHQVCAPAAARSQISFGHVQISWSLVWGRCVKAWRNTLPSQILEHKCCSSQCPCRQELPCILAVGSHRILPGPHPSSWHTAAQQHVPLRVTALWVRAIY